jgi:outer membrane receptor protein involved in Fe transport
MKNAVLCLLLSSVGLSAAVISGTIVDPSGALVGGAQVAVVTALGVVETLPAPNGSFEVKTAPEARLVFTAPGFAAQSVPADLAFAGMLVKLQLAPVVDSVRVVGSALDIPATEQGGSVAIIPRQEIEERNEPLAIDLLREVPGLTLVQTGPTGGLAGLYIRGGYPTFNLVEVDGAPVNAFGGDFDFAHIPSEELDHIEVISGPESAVYGPYANSGVVNFVTREPGPGPDLDVLAEGGTYSERRFNVSGGSVLAGFGIMASAAQMNTDGPVENSDYRNQNVMLNVTRRIGGSQSLALHGDFDSNENGVPGPYGSDPLHDFTGIDTISRNKNNFSDYSAHYQVDLSSRVRQEVSGAFFLNNNGFISPYGFTMNKDLRANGESRTVVSVTGRDVAAFGFSGGAEEVRNSYITDANYQMFPIWRRDLAAYAENRLQLGGHFFLNVGVRGESLHTSAIPPDGFSRPQFPAQTINAANPKVAATYALGTTRFHSSFGTGIRPPDGFDLAYTDNPALKPERTRSLDAGIEERFFHNWLSLDGTYFHNQFHDLIVVLGGSLAQLSHYESDNLANSRAQGAEFSAKLRPARWLFVEGSYTLLQTEILSLDGGAGLAPAPFYVGQELIRRPRNSGSTLVSFHKRRVSANVAAYYRGSLLDVEPTYGASDGLFRNPGYANVGINLNYSVGRGATIYGNLRNALNERYEETFGYPSPRLNFVTGVKWALPKRR